MSTTAPTTTRSQTIARLSTTIPQIFNEAQKPDTVLVRFSVSLRKIQEVCSLNTPAVPGEPQDFDYVGEEAFHKEFIRNGTDDMDEDMTGDQDLDSETISSRFVRVLMEHILRGLTAKALAVRLRCCQIIALSVSCLGELDEDLYQNLKTALFQRIKDKEAAVRIQAVTALSRLQSADEEPDEVDGLTIGQNEVRRVVLMNLEVTQQTLPYLIERARDVDAINRRLLYSRPLAEIPDFRMISSEDRYRLIKWGLSDRDAKVRAATGKMIADHWIKQADHNLLEFLERMDVMEGMEGGISEKMLASLLELRMSSMSIKFDAQFWDNLSPESAFLARVYTNVLHSNKMEEELDDVLPEVTRHAFYIQHYNNLWQQASKDNESDYEFIVAQLLGIGKRLDYADEVGRRKMYSVLRDIILVPDLPDDHVGSLVDLMSLTAMDECDFTRIMIDVISDIQEHADIDEAEVESSSKRVKLDDFAVKEDPTTETDPKILQMMLAKLKCLNICKFMLERCEQASRFNNHSTLLIAYTYNGKEVVLREEGLHCLGLVCHLDKDLALHNITLFEHCVRNGHEELKKKALMILFDLMMKFGYPTVSEKMNNTPKLFEYCLDNESLEVQYIASEGLAKLILSRSYKDEETLRLLVLLYFFPTMVDNSKLQQCLAYFFPAYCHSSSDNQQAVAKVTMQVPEELWFCIILHPFYYYQIAIMTLEQLITTYLDLEDGEKMVAPTTIAEMLTHWTDPRLVAEYRRSRDEVDMGVQGKMAVQIIDVLDGLSAHDILLRKVLCHMLPKLYLDDIDQETLTTIINRAKTLDDERPIFEAASRNQFNRVIRHLETLQVATGIREMDTVDNNPTSTRESSVSTAATAPSANNTNVVAIEEPLTSPQPPSQSSSPEPATTSPEPTPTSPEPESSSMQPTTTAAPDNHKDSDSSETSSDDDDDDIDEYDSSS
ncbi:hypothetical protein [Absidia glauca]|uniref:Nuclear condensin complex subunit 3 C-terminal domain-containing protein n=1 Tax=Absidia glauca TaxID=4829 RepID=A0A163M5Y4_ABSGL|nr:hypothetical protein [Absidia glauca]